MSIAETILDDWFDGSVVAGQDGAPLRVYHSTDVAIDRFITDRTAKARWSKKEPTKALNSMGAFFAPTVRESEQYACAPTLDQQFGRSVGRYKVGAVMYPTYLRIAKPKDYAWFEDIHKDLQSAGSPAVLKARLIEQGYDGLRIVSPADGRVEEYIVFEADQVRSVLAPDEPFHHPAMTADRAEENARRHEACEAMVTAVPIQ